MSASAYTPGLFAVIDIGTVTCRFLLVRVGQAGIEEVLFRDGRICNLGVGVDETGVLREEAMQRVEDAVRAFLAERDAVAAARGVEDAAGGYPAQIPTVCVATSASRDAANADVFRARIEALGVALSIIPGDREAALSFAGAGLDHQGEPVVVVDIGGGSTEIIAGEGGAEPVLARSFDIGCRRITERFLPDNPCAAAGLRAAGAWVADTVGAYLVRIRAAGFAGARVIAVAGTATSVVSVEKALAVYDPAQVHGTFVDRETVRRQLESLSCMDLETRRGVVGLDPKRADVVVGGLVILDAILEGLGAEGYTASETDLMDGAALALARGVRL